MNSQQQLTPGGEFLGSGLGYLVVRVTTARGAVPIPDATVQVRENVLDESNIIFVVKTDASGMTERIPLPAPSAADLPSPACVLPNYPYIVDVLAEGYHPQTYLDVTIYDGVTSYQSAELTPLSESPDANGIRRARPEIFGQDRAEDNPPALPDTFNRQPELPALPGTGADGMIPPATVPVPTPVPMTPAPIVPPSGMPAPTPVPMTPPSGMPAPTPVPMTPVPIMPPAAVPAPTPVPPPVAPFPTQPPGIPAPPAAEVPFAGGAPLPSPAQPPPFPGGGIMPNTGIPPITQ